MVKMKDVAKSKKPVLMGRLPLKLDDRGREILDSTPKVVSIGYVPLHVQINRMDELSKNRMAQLGVYDDFIDEDDFMDELDDIPDFISPHEEIPIEALLKKKVSKSKIKPAEGDKHLPAPIAKEDVKSPTGDPDLPKQAKSE